jgi:chemotaxis protein methyltransferase CheR
MTELSMSPQVFAILSGIVAEHAGLYFDQNHASIFGDKVAARAAQAGFDSLLDYYYFLRYDAGGPAELDALIEALVIGETYLFRELPPLQTAVSDFVIPALGRGRRPRVWCAACATGEEPHTLAMLLASRGVLDQVDIVASDINRTALTRGQSGRYAQRALRGEVPDFAAPWLDVQEREVTIDPRLTAAIDWRRINLMDGGAVAGLGSFDVILCRNVLIYFEERVARSVVDRLTNRLRGGGALLVGVSESLLRFGTSLACEEHGGVFVYRNHS